MSRVSITEEIRAELKRLNAETGVGPQRLLKGKADRPKGLNSAIIYRWLDGTIRTAMAEHLDFVLREWQNETSLEPLTDDDLAKLDSELKRTGYTPTSLLNHLSNVPNGLTPDLLHRLRSKRLKKVSSEIRAFLFEALSKLPNKAEKVQNPYLGRNTKSH